MPRGPALAELTLSTQENNELVQWRRRSKTSQALALRARIILACAGGSSNSEVARALRITKQTVGKWRSRFVAQRLDGLLDEPRPGKQLRVRRPAPHVDLVAELDEGVGEEPDVDALPARARVATVRQQADAEGPSIHPDRSRAATSRAGVRGGVG